MSIQIRNGTIDFASSSSTAFANAISGVGNVTKSGTGVVVLSGNNTYTSSTTVNAGTLRAGSATAFGNNASAIVNNGGTLDLNGISLSVGSLSSGGGTTGVVTLGSGTLTMGGDNSSTTFGGTVSGSGGLVKLGNGTQIFSGTNSYTGTTTVNAGILQFNSGLTTTGGAVRVEDSGTLQANASIGRAIIGSGPGNTINVGATGISLGDATSATGFSLQGTLGIGSNSITLNSLGFAQLGASTTLSGGTITAVNGVKMSGMLNGNGTVAAKFTGLTGSQIIASGGNLTLGSNVVGGFIHNGEISTGTNTVTILSSNRATLGSVTTLGSGSTAGTLNVANGAFVNFGGALQGYGTVDSTNSLAKAVIVNGDVYGTSVSNGITFTGYVKGTGTFTNTTFAGTYAPGLSPAIVNTTNATLTSSSTLEMEIAGTTAGSEHDKLIDSGTLTLAGTLKVIYLNGYAPTGNEVFDLFQWNTLAGTFSSIDFSQAQAPSGYAWNTSNLYIDGTLSFSPVPEPTTILTVCGFAVGGLATWRKWRRDRQSA
ncbi:MAG: autotransporter-associated beta strand repeat-containing protein [Gemmataceae bacterium]